MCLKAREQESNLELSQSHFFYHGPVSMSNRLMGNPMGIFLLQTCKTGVSSLSFICLNFLSRTFSHDLLFHRLPPPDLLLLLETFPSTYQSTRTILRSLTENELMCLLSSEHGGSSIASIYYMHIHPI